MFLNECSRTTILNKAIRYDLENMLARPIEFDRNQVLRDAMMVFWRRGYNAATLKDLSNATHLQPGSLYGAFRNKRTLFLQALESYFKEREEFTASILQESDVPPLVRIRQLFEALLQQSSQDEDKKGCLMVNTLLETPTNDGEINQRITQMLREIENTFKTVLEEAAKNGELPPHKQPAVLAKVLISGIFGLHVYNKTQPTDAELQQIIDGLLSVLE